MASMKAFALAAAVVAGVMNAGVATAGVTRFDGPAVSAPAGNFLDVRQFRVFNAQVPGGAGQPSVRQSVLVWQVATGTWNGQTLDGLAMVFVEQTPSDGRGARTLACYVSDYATPAQREALLAALASSQPQVREATSPGCTGGIRLEPAVIRIENDGQTVAVHLGLIS